MAELADIAGAGGNVGQFGFHREPKGSLPEAIGQAAAPQVARLKEIGQQVMDEGVGLQYPSMEEIEQAPEQAGTLSQVGQGALEATLDAVTPLGGLAGTIVSRGSKNWNEAKVLQTQQLTKPKALGGEGMSKREAAAITGYYKDRAGNYKTQISDKNSSISDLGTDMLQRWKPSQKLNEGGRWPRTKLASVYKHDTLYEEYPWIAANTEIKWTTDTNYAAVAPIKINSTTGKVESAVILVNPLGVDKYAEMMGLSRKEALRSMINHETNHVIQAIDELPGGSNKEYFNEVKKAQPAIVKKLKNLKATQKQIPETAPRYQELGEEIDRLQKHVDFVEQNWNTKAGDLYYNTLGEADAFWSQAVRNQPQPQYQLPTHEDVTRNKVRMEGPDWLGGYHNYDFDVNRMAITSQGYKTLGEVAPISPLRDVGKSTPKAGRSTPPNFMEPLEGFTKGARVIRNAGEEPGEIVATKMRAGELMVKVKFDKPIPNVTSGDLTYHWAPAYELTLAPRAGTASDFGIAASKQDMTAYHASPHIFDQFDLSKVGTGEGAAAFGHGLYLSETKKVQDFYHGQFQRVLDAEQGSIRNRIDALKTRMNQPRLDEASWRGLQKEVGQLQKQLETRDWNAQRYEIDIPDSAVEKMMDWDAPIAKQPKVVQDMAKKIRNVYGPSREYMSGSDFYKNLKVHLGSDKAASDWLNKNGVPGMRYFDGDSRQATYGTRNFVIFDDTIPKIKHRGADSKDRQML